MSDPNLTMQRQILALDDQMEQLRKADAASILLPYAQRALNSVAVTAALGDFAQPWPAYFLVFVVNVFVATTNDGTNFWTIALNDQTGAIIATVNTSSGVTASTWTRLSDTTVTQPVSTNAQLTVVATKSASPGALHAVPGVIVLRTGN